MQRSGASREGQVIDGRYRLLAPLGMGGMGHVYAAEHVGLRQRCALKFLHAQVAQKPGAVKRFLREARVLASLRHRSIVTVSDVGADTGDAFYVMELLEGADLRAVLRREKRLPWRRVRVLAIQLAEALAVAHDVGVIHRDMKPENCFLVRGGGDVLVKILDFGIAKLLAEPGGTKLTAAGEALGTVGYMPPEQCEGQGDRRVDVYALGIMLYEMLAGQPPYTGSSYEILARLIRRVEPPHLSETCPDVPDAIAGAIRKAMALDPGARFQDMREMLAVLHALPVDGPPHAPVAAPAAVEKEELHATIGMADTVLGAAPEDAPPSEPDAGLHDELERSMSAAVDRQHASRVDRVAAAPNSTLASIPSAPPRVPRKRRGWWVVVGAAAASLLALALWRHGFGQDDASGAEDLASVADAPREVAAPPHEPTPGHDAVVSLSPVPSPRVPTESVDPMPGPTDKARASAPESPKQPVLTQPRLKSLARDALHRAGAASTNGPIEIAVDIRVNSKGVILGLAPRFPNPADWPRARQEAARSALTQLLTTSELKRAMKETGDFTIKLMLPGAR